MRADAQACVLALWLLAAAPVAPAAPPPPDQALRQTTERIQASIRQNHAAYRADPARFRRMVDEMVVPSFDQQAIGRLVLGRHWRGASDAQRRRFVAAFRNSLVYSYADALLEYHDTVRAQWKPARVAADAGEATVDVDLLRPAGPPVPLGFAVRRVDDEWKIYDVTVEGVSLAAAFRSQFAAEIGKNGLEALIQRLERGGPPPLEGPVRREPAG